MSTKAKKLVQLAIEETDKTSSQDQGDNDLKTPAAFTAPTTPTFYTTPTTTTFYTTPTTPACHMMSTTPMSYAAARGTIFTIEVEERPVRETETENEYGKMWKSINQ